MEAGPFISLALKGADKVIDKHFDKVPHKYLYGETYKPNALKKRSRKNQDQKNSEEGENDDNVADESDTEDHLKERDIVIGRDMDHPMPRDGSLPGGAYSQESPYVTPPLYSHEPPRPRPQYMPEPPPPPTIGVAGGYYPPPPSQTFASPNDRRSRDRRRDSWDDDDDYYSDSYRQPRRPRPITRRSSSYHGPRGRDRDYDDHDDHDEGNKYGTLVASRGKTPSGLEIVDKARNTAHRYGLKEELEGTFTKSKMGLTGGAVGALVAGWAANKAQVAYSKDKKAKDPDPLLTLLGAAVGGLAVNAIVEKYEEGKQNTEDKQEQYDEKWGKNRDDSRSESGRSQKSSKRKDDRDRNRGGYISDGRRKHKRDSAYGSDGYD